MDGCASVAARFRKKTIRRDKSRVQFFVDGDSTHVTNRVDRNQRTEDSPADSVKSEYSGTDLRKCFNSHSVVSPYLIYTFKAEADSEIKNSGFTFESPVDEPGKNRSTRPAHLRCDSYGASSETDSDFSKVSGFETPDGRLLYRSYIERALKSRGLRKMLR